MTPAYITTFDLLTWTQALAAECVRLGLRPILLDNASTFPPMVEWLSNCPYEVIRRKSNGGPWAFFNDGLQRRQTGPYVVTDSDLDLSGVPDDAVERMLHALDLNPTWPKAGLSIEIDDLPEHYQLRDHVRRVHRRWWKNPLPGGCFGVQVATTFAVYLPEREPIRARNKYLGLRMDRPYTARHLPWYLDWSGELPADVQHFIDRFGGTSYWSHLHRKVRNKT
jgi:hypothetical protein